MTKAKMTAKPPIPQVDKALAKEFVSKAGKPANQITNVELPDNPLQDLPWNAPHVRDDLYKPRTFRLTERMFIKLQWIAKNGPQSAEAFVRDILDSALDEKINELLNKD